MKNYGELKAEIANWLDRTDQTANIPGFIKLAESKIYRVLRTRENEFFKQLPLGPNPIPLPQNYKESLLLAINDKQIRHVSNQDFQARKAAGYAGPETVFTIIERSMYIWPEQSGSGGGGVSGDVLTWAATQENAIGAWHWSNNKTDGTSATYDLTGQGNESELSWDGEWASDDSLIPHVCNPSNFLQDPWDTDLSYPRFQMGVDDEEPMRAAPLKTATPRSTRPPADCPPSKPEVRRSIVGPRADFPLDPPPTIVTMGMVYRMNEVENYSYYEQNILQVMPLYTFDPWNWPMAGYSISVYTEDDDVGPEIYWNVSPEWSWGDSVEIPALTEAFRKTYNSPELGAWAYVEMTVNTLTGEATLRINDTVVTVDEGADYESFYEQGARFLFAGTSHDDDYQSKKDYLAGWVLDGPPRTDGYPVFMNPVCAVEGADFQYYGTESIGEMATWLTPTNENMVPESQGEPADTTERQDEATTRLLLVAPDVYLYGALSEAYRLLREPTKSAEYKALMVETITDLNMEHATAQFTGSTAEVKSVYGDI